MKNKKIIKSLILIAFCMTILFSLTGCESNTYKKAVDLFEHGNYAEARQQFEQLEDYEDSAEYIKKCNKKTISTDLIGNWVMEGTENETMSFFEFQFNSDGTVNSRAYTLTNKGVYSILDDSISITYVNGKTANINFKYDGDQLQLFVGGVENKPFVKR